MSNIGWTLVIAGLAIAAVGLFFVFGPSVPWLGRLPGDIRIEGEHTRFYFPITTCIILSVVLSLVAWVIRNLGADRRTAIVTRPPAGFWYVGGLGNPGKTGAVRRHLEIHCSSRL